MQVLASGLANATLVRSACSLLRQLANSDAIKAEIVDAGGLELLCRAVDAHMTHAGEGNASAKTCILLSAGHRTLTQATCVYAAFGMQLFLFVSAIPHCVCVSKYG